MEQGMDRKLRVGVIFGGRSGEHDVSIMSSRSVLSVLDPQKYEVFQIAITRQGAWLTGPDAWSALESNQLDNLSAAVLFPEPGSAVLYALRPGNVLEPVTTLDVLFPVLHGTFGEDGTLQGLLEMADVAYVGAGVLGSSVGMDKALFKDVMRANGLPVVESVLLSRHQVEEDLPSAIQAIETLGYPVFSKPANLGSSVGIMRCRNRSELHEGLLEAARFDRRVLVERGVPNAREIEVSVLGNDQPIASIPGEIIPGDAFYSYEAKYIMDNSKLLIPAPLSQAQAEQARAMAVRAYQAIDCAGMARVDFLLDGVSGDLYINEVNTIPGFTKISMYPKLWEASGISYRDLVDRLIELAFERKADRDHTERQFRRGS
jgi:D-alanine-D-alanine ligase